MTEESCNEVRKCTSISAGGLLVLLLGLAGRWHRTAGCGHREREGGIRAAGRVGWQLEALQHTACQMAYGMSLEGVPIMHEQVELAAESASSSYDTNSRRGHQRLANYAEARASGAILTRQASGSDSGATLPARVPERLRKRSASIAA